MGTNIATLISLIPLLTSFLSLPMQAYNFFMTPRLESGAILNLLPTDTYQIVEYMDEVKLPGSSAPIYNGSILYDPANPNRYLISYRQTENQYTDKLKETTGLLTLDRSWRIRQQQVLDLTTEYNDLHKRRYRLNQAEDVRLFTAQGQLYAIYNAIHNDHRTDMILATLKRKEQKFSAVGIKRLYFAPLAKIMEKNWTPFVYENKIYFIYSSAPRTILSFDASDENIKFAYETYEKIHEQNYQWAYGVIKGGTPAEYIPELDAYLTFFHSNLPYKHGNHYEILKEPHWRVYFMGAYVFEAKPPFRILAITTKPLTYAGLYQDKVKNYHIIFPTGFITTNDDFIISAGIDDRKLALLKINKPNLYQKLTWFNGKT